MKISLNHFCSVVKMGSDVGCAYGVALSREPTNAIKTLAVSFVGQDADFSSLIFPLNFSNSTETALVAPFQCIHCEKRIIKET